MKRSIAIWIRNGTLLLIVGTFALFFGPQSQIGDAASIGSVNGERIERSVFEFLRAQRRQDEQQLRDQGLTARMARDLIDQQVFEQLVRIYLLSQEARALGLVVSDAELRDEICSQPAYQTDGKCDPNRFRAILRNAGFSSEREHLDIVRRELLSEKLARYVAAPIRISEAAARDRIQHDQTTLRLRYVAFGIESYGKELNPSDAEIDALLQSDAARIDTQYELRKLEFDRPEQVRARHILFTGDEAEAQANEARKRLEAGEDFAQLAEELSQDPATSRAGGDLGFFPRGRVEAPLEDAAFGAEVGAVVGPVKTERGFHLLRVEEKQAAIEKSEDEAKRQIARDLWIQDRARAAALENAESLVAEVGSGKPITEVAASRGWTVNETPEFAVTSVRIPGLPPMDGLREAVLALTPDAPISPRPLTGPEAIYVIALLDRTSPPADRVDSQADAARMRLTSVSREEVLRRIYERSRTEAQEAGGIQVGLESLYR